MKKAKKRAVSLILTVTLAMAMFLAMPISAFAAPPDLVPVLTPGTAVSSTIVDSTTGTNPTPPGTAGNTFVVGMNNTTTPMLPGIGVDWSAQLPGSVDLPTTTTLRPAVGYYLEVTEIDSFGTVVNTGSVQVTNNDLLAPTAGATTITGGEEKVTVSNYATVTGCTLYLVPSSLYPSGGGAIALNNSAIIVVTANGDITVPAGNYALYTVYTSGFTSPEHGSYVAGTPVTVTAAAGSGAPVLTSGSVGRTSNTTATVSFTSDSAGQYAWQLDGTAPAVTTLALSTPVTMVVGTNTISLTGLTPGPHTIYIVAQGANQIVSETLIIGIPGYTAGGSTAGSPSTDVPQTGDSSNTQAWIIVLIGSLLGLCALTVLRKRLKADDQR